MSNKSINFKIQSTERVCDIRLYTENNLKLENLDLKPFDVIICDGPYGIVPPCDEVAGPVCDWDPFVLNSKGGSKKFGNYYRMLFNMCVPHMKKTASIFICGFPEGISVIKNLLDNEYDLNFRRSITWVYKNHYDFDQGLNFHRSHETILYYTRTKENFIFNGKGIRDVLECPIINDDFCEFKDGAKPLEVSNFFLNTAGFTGARLLSLFAGSGTDLVAAVKHNMDAVGFEFNKAHVDMIIKRLNAVKHNDSIS